ncbi:Serine/threonine-protein kinase RIO3 [Blattella germanica]|nr:Serine/threonine-protein kinase RIO3 [Blattella germanica]
MEASKADSVPISPWGKLQQPTEAVCLADIMSEELAKDLQLKEEDRYVNNLTEETEHLPIFENAPGCDSDHMIAQMLQIQFDKEYDDMLKRTEDKFNGTSKVGISYSNYRVIPENLLYDSDEEECEVDEKHREWDSFVSTEKAFKAMPKCGYKKEGDEMVTKHDMTMSGRRNACRVMEFPPEFQTGDGGGFDMQLSNKVFNSLKVYSRSEQSRRNRLHDKSEQATAEMSVDPRTRLLLYRLVNQEILDRVNGILSTGKEAVVLHADGGAGRDCIVPKECAIKIFKTTLNEFKSRDKYIEDDYRFKARFSKQNPRKIIHMWAEKEMHNLMKMKKFGILCPEVVTLKKHVLVMSFIGENHKPAEKLKEAFLKPADLTEAYTQILATMKKLYEDAQLVHADLSEYNILWHNKQCWFIDVSQSVDRNHPKALEFLYRDCGNITNFFQRKGTEDVKSSDELFMYITGLPVSDCDVHALGHVQDFEKCEELLTCEKTEKPYPFDYCWEKSKNE